MAGATTTLSLTQPRGLLHCPTCLFKTSLGLKLVLNQVHATLASLSFRTKSSFLLRATETKNIPSLIHFSHTSSLHVITHQPNHIDDHSLLRSEGSIFVTFHYTVSAQWVRTAIDFPSTLNSFPLHTREAGGENNSSGQRYITLRLIASFSTWTRGLRSDPHPIQPPGIESGSVQPILKERHASQHRFDVYSEFSA